MQYVEIFLKTLNFTEKKKKVVNGVRYVSCWWVLNLY